jgi:hypothetical protein
MARILLIILALFMDFFTYAQIQTNESSVSRTDTLKSFLVRRNPPYLYSVRLNKQEASIGHKLKMANLYVAGFNITMGVSLILAPDNLSKWDKKDKLQIEAIGNQYKKSFTLPPVIDKDFWFINYLGHPYQGSYYYNAMRSQNVSAWHSALFCLGQSLLWEYGWEAGMEQPSIQDMITTPIGGILIGELTHVATIKMSKNGFRWYEKALVCLINPTYAFNIRFKFNRPQKP